MLKKIPFVVHAYTLLKHYLIREVWSLRKRRKAKKSLKLRDICLSKKKTWPMGRRPGTALKNAATGETIYTPPQDYDEIIKLMANLEKYINDSSLHDCDPLIKMAIIHFQFESIHPFEDGNGRIGRSIAEKALLQTVGHPLLLSLSVAIEKDKNKYYESLISNCQEIADYPNLGKNYDGITQNLLGIKTNRHIIFYRTLNENFVEITRILHERMDLKKRIAE